MSNFTVLGGLLLKVFLIGVPITLLYFVIISRKSTTATIIFSCLFILSLLPVIHFFKSTNDRKRVAVKNFIGYYKLGKLNKQDCENCKLNLLENYRFDILQNGNVIGTGKWDLKFDSEGGGYYLAIEGGPNYMIEESKREVEAIDFHTKSYPEPQQ